MMVDKDKIIQFALENARQPVSGLGALLAEHFSLSRQVASKYLSALRKKGWLVSSGHGRSTLWKIGSLEEKAWSFPLAGLLENDAWHETMYPLVKELPENIRDILHYGFTEILNNSIDHSQGRKAIIQFTRTPLESTIMISDDGEGIFQRIQRILGLYDARTAILELSKGKLTTDPGRHSGEGIFFTSRIFDNFYIMSRDLFFSHKSHKDDWLIEGVSSNLLPGTSVWMTIANDSEKTTKSVFDRFANPDDYSFSKTIIPVRLAAHEGEKLVSRSQAKGLVMRFERFKTVMLDFKGVEQIGQAFADDVFRVFKSSHPAVELIVCHAAQPVLDMIKRAEATRPD